MGKIINKREQDGKIIYTIELDKKEILSAKGNLKKIHFFCSKSQSYQTRVMRIGRFHSQFHFVVPKKLRIRLSKKQASPEKSEHEKLERTPEGTCQRIEINGQTYFIYVIPKESEANCLSQL